MTGSQPRGRSSGRSCGRRRGKNPQNDQLTQNTDSPMADMNTSAPVRRSDRTHTPSERQEYLSTCILP